MNLDNTESWAPEVPSESPLDLHASYYTLDVTTLVRNALARAPPGLPVEIHATNDTFGTDPSPRNVKQLSIAYAYRRSGFFHIPTAHFATCVVAQGESIITPPPITIHAVYWAGQDITTALRARIAGYQSLHLDITSIQDADPWYNVSKSISIMYQYGQGPLQLFVTHDGVGVQSITPTGPPRVSSFNLQLGRQKKRMGNTNTRRGLRSDSETARAISTDF